MTGGRYVNDDLTGETDDDLLDLLIWVSVDHGDMPGQWEKVERLKKEALRRMDLVVSKRGGSDG